MTNDNHCLLCGSDLADYDETVCGVCADKVLGTGHDHKKKPEVKKNVARNGNSKNAT
ncbi:hypothetical protein ACFLY8_02300 [Halobacteriota archaeon]